MDPAEYEALEATAAEVAAELSLTKLSVPELIYRMHKQFRDQRVTPGRQDMGMES